MSCPTEIFHEHLYSAAEGGVSPLTILTPPAVRPPLHPMALNTQYGGKRLPQQPRLSTIRPMCTSPTLRLSQLSQNCSLELTSNNNEDLSNKQLSIVKKTENSENLEIAPLTLKRAGSPLVKNVVTFDNKNYYI